MREESPLQNFVSRHFGLASFTLVELLVSMAVVAMLLTFVMQLLSNTTATITASSKQIDTASLARIVLDRFEDDFSGARLNAGATALYYSESGDAGNSAIAFVSGARARGPTTQTNPWTTDTRSAFVGYRVRLVTQNIGGTNTPSIASLNRGDGRFTLSVADMGNQASQNLWDVFGTGNKRIPNDLTAVTDDQRLLNWQIIGSGIFRLHISFVLDDGQVVQTPPSYRNFFANGGMGTTGCIPITFSQTTSADINLRYVKGLIVGVAVLDETTRNLAYKVDNSFWTTVGNKILRPTGDGQTPVQVWSENLRTLISNDPADPKYLFPPVRQSIRFYQRFYGVNL
jgi:type II secretory pathway pseudopilin PulG